MPLTKIDTGAIKDDAINSAKIADGTVVASDVLDNTITGAKLASDIAISTSGNITTTGALTSTGIDDNATSTAITIDSSENVGIGTASPNTALQVEKDWVSSYGSINISHSTNSLGGIGIRCNDVYKGGLIYRGGTSGANWELTANDAEPIVFKTNNSEVMRINSSGNVGIGESSPAKTLSVNSGGLNIVARFESTDQISFIEFKDGNTTTTFPPSLGADGNSLVFNTDNVEAMRIDSSSNVGIGTTSPNALLDLGGAGSTYQSGHEKITIAASPSPYNYYPSLSTHNRSYLHLTGSGGGSAFNTSIHGYQVGNPAGGSYIKVAPDLTNTFVLYHKTDVTGFKWYADYNKSTGDADFTPSEEVSFNFATDTGAISFNESSRDRDFRVESNNNNSMLFVDGGNDRVGIGTNSPSSELEVYGASTPKITVKSNDGTSSSLILRRGNADDTLTDFELKNNAGDLEFFGDNTSQNDYKLVRFSTTEHRYYTNNSERMRITSSGDVGIGESSPSVKLHVREAGASAFTVIKARNNTVAADTGAAIELAGFYNAGKIAGTSDNAAVTGIGALRFYTWNGSSFVERMVISSSGAVNIVGSLSKGSGSFKIDHPLPEKTNTHHLVHSFVESPQANNIYRGKVDLISGTATVNIDTVSGMTEGTFVLLNRDIQCFTSNETGWTAVKGSVSGNTLTITAQDNTCTDTISWMVIGERQDQHMYDTDWTDENGKVIVEPLK